MTRLAWAFFWISVVLGLISAALYPGVDAGRVAISGGICFWVGFILAMIYGDGE